MDEALLRFFLIFTFFLNSFPAAAGGVCSRLNYSELLRQLTGKEGVQVIFFASWCSGCKAHLKNADSNNAILISVFDEEKTAEEIVLKMKLKSKCFISDGIEKKLKVSDLPKTLVWSKGEFQIH